MNSNSKVIGKISGRFLWLEEATEEGREHILKSTRD